MQPLRRLRRGGQFDRNGPDTDESAAQRGNEDRIVQNRHTSNRPDSQPVAGRLGASVAMTIKATAVASASVRPGTSDDADKPRAASAHRLLVRCAG
jgi:hypothetical protein